jgi:exonuclease VII small subunit
MKTKVIEFKYKNEYEEWLKENEDIIEIINVATTKRWSLLGGFLGDTKTYTITYKQLENEIDYLQLSEIVKELKQKKVPYEKVIEYLNKNFEITEEDIKEILKRYKNIK